MAPTTRPLPKTAASAFALLQQQIRTQVEQLGVQVCEDLALPADGTWKIDWPAGLLIGPDAPEPPETTPEPEV